MADYLSTGLAGTPGLLAAGGSLAGGLPVSRPDLHFLYNLAETTPLILAFLHQVGGAVRRGIRPRRVRLVAVPPRGHVAPARSA